MTPLQVSSVACFAPAAVLCMWCSAPCAGCALTVNCVTSLIVHRPARGAARDATDTADLLAIALWVVCNLSMVPGAHGAGQAAACVLAVACVVLNHARLQLRWRSRGRNAVHAALHACGALGTVCLCAR